MTITVTSPAINPEVRTLFKRHTSKARDLQVSIQKSVNIINQFLSGATIEGLKQTVEALKEYDKVRKQLIDLSGDEPKQEKEEKKETKSEASPTPTCATKYPNIILCKELSMDYQFANGYQDAKRKFPKGTRIENPPKEVTDSGIPCYGKGGTHRLVKDEAGSFLGSLVCCPCCQNTPAGPVLQEQCAFKAQRGGRFYKQNP